MVCAWPWDDFLRKICFLILAEGPASAVLVFGVRITTKSTDLLRFKLISAWPWIITMLLIYSSICYSVARAVRNIREKIFACFVKGLERVIVSWSWIFDGKRVRYGYFFIHTKPFGAREAIWSVVVCRIRRFWLLKDSIILDLLGEYMFTLLLYPNLTPLLTD